MLQNGFCADLVIEISDVNKQQDGFYRLVYDPPYGSPPPNTTISSREIGDSIQFSNGLPGTNYNFWLYYTNQTHHDWLTWRVSITTGEYQKSNFNSFAILNIFINSARSAVESFGVGAKRKNRAHHLESAVAGQLLIVQAENPRLIRLSVCEQNNRD